MVRCGAVEALRWIPERKLHRKMERYGQNDCLLAHAPALRMPPDLSQPRCDAGKNPAATHRVRLDSSVHAVELDLTVLDIWDADVKSESFWAKLKIRARWVCR